MKIGVVVGLSQNIRQGMETVRRYGLDCCQLHNWDMNLFTPEMAECVKAAAAEYDVTITSLWGGWSGPRIWDLQQGPLTLGLLPEAYRSERVRDLKRASDFASWIGVNQIATHMGFIPENPNDPSYAGMVVAMRDVAQYMQRRGQWLLFETGQETPVTLKRAFEDIGTTNLGVNLDPANLILYGKANPVDALDLLGPYVRDVHAKDGLYPVSGRLLGEETPLGEGKVHFESLIPRLKEFGYDGALTIEREISGEQQAKDILKAKALLEALL